MAPICGHGPPCRALRTAERRARGRRRREPDHHGGVRPGTRAGAHLATVVLGGSLLRLGGSAEQLANLVPGITEGACYSLLRRRKNSRATTSAM